MHISKEVRTGLLVAVSLIVLFTGFYFLKGADLFSNNRQYYAYYESVGGLLTASTVEVHGLNVGHVSALELVPGKGVKVTFLVQKSTAIPKGTVAVITSDGLLGTKMVRLDMGNGPDAFAPESEIPSAAEASLMDNMSDQISPLMKGLRKTVAALDTVIAGVTLLTNAENRQTITATLKSINSTADNLAKLTNGLAAENDEIKSIVHNTNSFTTSLAKNNDTIKHLLSNLNSVSGQLANSHIQKTFNDLQGSVTQLQGILSKVNNNEGSLGLLVNNKDLYNNMNGSLKSLDKLLADLKEHPSRYVNISVFGKKKK